MTIRPHLLGQGLSAPLQAAAASAPNRSDFAWEFLRRNPAYMRAARARTWTRSQGDEDAVAAPWGLRFIADPGLPASRAEVFWRPEVAPGVVVVFEPVAVDTGQAIRLNCNLATRRLASEGLHLRLEAGLQALIKGGDASAAVAAVVPFNADLSVRLRAVRAFHRAVNGHRRPLNDLTPQQRLRLIRALSALDQAQAQRTYRQIGEHIFGAQVLGREPWKTSSVRDTTIRLVRAGRALMEGSYLRLLRPGTDAVGDGATAPSD